MNKLPIQVLNIIKAFNRKIHPLAILLKESFAYEQYSKYRDQIESHTCFHKFYFDAYDIFTSYDMDFEFQRFQACLEFDKYLHCIRFNNLIL